MNVSCLYLVEPVLLTAALRCLQDVDDCAKILEHLNSFVSGPELGFRGELAAQLLILILAGGASHLDRDMSLSKFLAKLLYPDKSRNDDDMKQDIAALFGETDPSVRLLGFATAFCPDISLDVLEKSYELGVGVLPARGKPAFDLLIPVRFRNPACALYLWAQLALLARRLTFLYRC